MTAERVNADDLSAVDAELGNILAGMIGKQSLLDEIMLLRARVDALEADVTALRLRLMGEGGDR